jgi:hypothetical protein
MESIEDGDDILLSLASSSGVMPGPKKRGKKKSSKKQSTRSVSPSILEP